MSHAKLPADRVMRAIKATNDVRRAATSDTYTWAQGERLRMLERLAQAALACDAGELFVSAEDFDLISLRF